MLDGGSVLAAWLGGVASLVRDGGGTMPALVLVALVLWYGLTQRILGVRLDRAAVERRVLRAVAGRRTKTAREEAARIAVAEVHAALGQHRTLVQGLAFAAPLLGLLGTVSGMIETFDALGQQAMFRQSGGIAGGISEALLTTQLGLCVAIPGTLLGRMLEKREDRLHDDIHEIVGRVVRGEEEECAA